MKTQIFIWMAIGLLGFSSCKKDYTCKCDTNTAGVTTSNTRVIKDTKSNAESTCKSGNSTTSALGFTVSVSCSLQ